jgi:alpha-amylase
MASVCFYFQVHQPDRLRRFSIFDSEPNYYDETANAHILRKVAHKSYLPSNALLYELINRYDGEFKIAYSLSGVLIEQLERFMPEVLVSFQRLADTGCVEFMAETYYHSLSFLYSREEFTAQVEKHADRIEELFGQRPRVFRNTELIYSNDVATHAANMGYETVLCEGTEMLLGYRAPTRVYTPPGADGPKLLLKNYRLSDDIAFRFGDRAWAEWPMTADRFADKINALNENGQVVNLFMDYETFGEHQWAETGIFDFLRYLPEEVFARGDDFKTPSEVADTYDSAGEYDAPHMISWADSERDLSAWLGNAMQSNAAHELFQLERRVKAANDPELLQDWRRLQTSDHYYYMCTKFFADGDVHKYFNPYDSPYDSYINFMNVMDNLHGRLPAVSSKKAS